MGEKFYVVATERRWPENQMESGWLVGVLAVPTTRPKFPTQLFNYYYYNLNSY